MNIVDMVILGILGVSVVVGLYRGFVASIASLGGCLLSLGVSFWLTPKAVDWVQSNLQHQVFQSAGLNQVGDYVSQTILSAVLHVICFVLCFLLCFLVLHLVLGFLKAVFKFPVLKQLNSLAGGVFGLLRGALLCFIAFALLPLIQTIAPVGVLEELVAASTLAPLFNSDQLILAIMNGGF